MNVADFRSDTVTRPSAAMRAAMAGAEVGDDVLDGDPSVRRLEEQAAAWLGKEGALFVPSGTMANQVAVGAWTAPGSEVIVERRAHVLDYEAGALAALHGVQTVTLSIDGLQETHDKLRGRARSWERAFAAMRRVAALGVQVSMNSQINAWTYPELLPLLELGPAFYRLFQPAFVIGEFVKDLLHERVFLAVEVRFRNPCLERLDPRLQRFYFVREPFQLTLLVEPELPGHPGFARAFPRAPASLVDRRIIDLRQ